MSQKRQFSLVFEKGNSVTKRELREFIEILETKTVDGCSRYHQFRRHIKSFEILTIRMIRMLGEFQNEIVQLFFQLQSFSRSPGVSAAKLYISQLLQDVLKTNPMLLPLKKF
jgi:hypothetical protein